MATNETYQLGEEAAFLNKIYKNYSRLVFPLEGSIGMEWKDIEIHMHMQVLLRTLVSWNSLGVDDPDVH